MFCIKCGNALEDGDRFCTRCGAPIEAEMIEKLDTPPTCCEEMQVSSLDCEQKEESDAVTDETLLMFDLKSAREPSVTEAFELKSNDAQDMPSQKESTDAPRKPSLGKRAVISFVFSIVAAQLAILGVFAWIPLILAVPTAVVGLIFALKAFSLFRSLDTNGRGSNISPLVLSVIGAVFSAFALFAMAIIFLLLLIAATFFL